MNHNTPNADSYKNKLFFSLIIICSSKIGEQ
jgi:hypothetical protein